MDTDELITTIKSRFDHNAAKKALKEKYEAKMLFAHNGGMWRAGPELISFLHVWAHDLDQLEIILEDEYGNPCKVDLHEFLALAKERWQEQMNAWLNEYEKIQKER